MSAHPLPTPINRKLRAATIKLAAPYPLLDPGEYEAECMSATFDWTNHFKAWKAILTLKPLNYSGRPYHGSLCKFLGLGKNPEAPYAGPRSDFRKLYVEVNGAQPTTEQVRMDIFVGARYSITVETVTKDRKEGLLAPEHQYSIVRSLRPLKPGEPFNVVNSKNSGNSGNPSTDQPSNLGNQPLGKTQRRQSHDSQFG